MASVWQLEVGDTIRIVREFRDVDRRAVQSGQDLRLVKKDLFPHDGGITLTFEGGLVIRLSENEPSNDDILINKDEAFFLRV